VNCKNLRIAFVKRTGRYDLVEDGANWADKGANEYLNRGQKLLDSLIVLPHHERRWFKRLAAGDWQVRFPSLCRTVRAVEMADSTQKWPLDLVSMEELRRTYAAGDFSAVTPGTPAVFTPSDGAINSTQAGWTAQNFAGMHDWEDVQYSLGEGANAYEGIVWMPPCAADGLTVSVWGLWYTSDLVNDEDKTWWSINEPDLTLRAATAEMEADLRNSEGYNDAVNAMQPKLKQLDFDQAYRESLRHGSKIRG
jgi:hypothetical protein